MFKRLIYLTHYVTRTLGLGFSRFTKKNEGSFIETGVRDAGSTYLVDSAIAI